jgi:sulfur relay (sulfurtransferase) complex TusBCD TusD component (DsrE family)
VMHSVRQHFVSKRRGFKRIRKPLYTQARAHNAVTVHICAQCTCMRGAASVLTIAQARTRVVL